MIQQVTKSLVLKAMKRIEITMLFISENTVARVVKCTVKIEPRNYFRQNICDVNVDQATNC